MVATITVVNIHHLTWLQIYFLVINTSKIYSLSNVQIYNIALFILITMLYVKPPGCIYLISGRFYFFDHRFLNFI